MCKYYFIDNESEMFIFNFSEQAAFVCLMMRQRSENVLEFTLGNYFLYQLSHKVLH